MANLTMSSEDDIIKKRLLIEGDSGNEDRLINKLIKNFVKWSNTPFSHAATATNGNGEPSSTPINDEENPDYLYEQMMASLSHAEFGLLRNQFILDMNKMEQDNYEVLYKKINSEIERAKKKILESKKDLQEARKIRKNRQEYDILARQILNYSDRARMQAKIKELEDKVESLKKQEYESERKLDLRRKQFGVVLQSLSVMKNLIENDLKFDDYLADPIQQVTLVSNGLKDDDQMSDSAVNAISTSINPNDQALTDSDIPKVSLEDTGAKEFIAKSNESQEDAIDEENLHHGKHEKNYAPNNEVEMEEY